jgi:hypothetical protein
VSLLSMTLSLHWALREEVLAETDVAAVYKQAICAAQPAIFP